MSSTVARTARDRARAEITAEIMAAARRRLATDGAAALSLRAIARDVGMVSSAVYRYVPSRDALLTALIVEAYDAVGRAAEDADAHPAAHADPAARFLAVCRAVRAWALEHPHEYALIYGSPVPGYRAPQDTIPPASRVGVVLAGILAAAAGAGRIDDAALAPVTREVAAALAPIRPLFGDTDLALLDRGIVAWTHLFGAISFELFGHRHNVVADDQAAAYFDHEMALLGRLTGIR